MHRFRFIWILALLTSSYFAWQVFFVHPGEQYFHDSGFAQSQNSSSCASCHDNGSDLGKIGQKSSYLINGRSLNSVETVIDKVMIPFFLEGVPIGETSQEMKDLVDYLEKLTAEK